MYLCVWAWAFVCVRKCTGYELESYYTSLRHSCFQLCALVHMCSTVGLCVRGCMRACVRACMCVCMRVCIYSVCVCACVCMHASPCEEMVLDFFLNGRIKI